MEKLEFRIGMAGAFIAPAIFLVGAISYFVYFKVFDTTALTMSAIVGLLIAALFARKYKLFWEHAIEGVASPIAMTVIMILFVVGPLSSLLEVTGVSQGFVWLADVMGVSGGLFIAVVFAAACAMAVSTGTSLGTLFTAFPIFYPAGAALDANAALLAGAIFSGAMFGDNIAPISDTTIVSSSTQKYRKRKGAADVAGVVASRLRYSLTAAGVTFILFLIAGYLFEGSGTGEPVATGGASPQGLLMLIPVAALIVVAFWKRDLFLAITVGLLAGVLVGLVSGLLAPSDIVSVQDGAPSGFIFNGINGMLPLIGLTLGVFGIVGVLRAAGVFDSIIATLSSARWAQGPRGAEVAIGAGQTITTTLFAGVVGPSIVTFGPVADEIGARAGLHPYRRANVMECFGMGLASIVPAFSAFLFIISQLTEGQESMPALAPVEVAATAFYPIVLFIVMVISVATGWGRTFEGADGTPTKTRPATEEESVSA